MATGSATVLPATVTPIIGFQEGVVVGQTGVLVTEFSYNNPTTTSGFAAQINPGDGSIPVAGVVTALGNGLFGVSLPHGYIHAGVDTATTTVISPHGAMTSTTSVIEVGDLFVGIAGSLTVATFNVGNPAAQASSYTATIAWGDGTSGTGTVSGNGGLLTVGGSHTYTVDSIDAPNGGYQVIVTLSKPGQPNLTAINPVVVTRPLMRGQSANTIENSTGILNSQTIAIFEVPNNSDTASEFAAMINWGDGTSSSGTISGSNGLFTVAGGHSYTTAGTYVIQVSVDQAWNLQLLVLMTAGMAAQNAPTNLGPPRIYTGNPLPVRTGLTHGAIFFPLKWKISVPSSGNKPNSIIGSVGGQTPTKKGGIILQRVTMVITLTGTTPAFANTVKDAFPGYTILVQSGNTFTLTNQYWEAWVLPPGQTSVDGNGFGGLIPKPVRVLMAKTDLLAPTSHNDAFWSAGFSGAKAGTLTITGSVYYVDGATLKDVGLDGTANQTASPAGTLPSRNAQVLYNGQSNSYDLTMGQYISDQQKNAPNSISNQYLHVLKVKWDENGSEKGSTIPNPDKNDKYGLWFKAPNP